MENRTVMKSWPEYAVCNIWPQVKHDQNLRQYVPDKDFDNSKYCDRTWVWNLIFTLCPRWAQEYCAKVYRQRYAKPVKDFSQAKVIKVSAAWMERLKAFDFKSQLSEFKRQS